MMSCRMRREKWGASYAGENDDARIRYSRDRDPRIHRILSPPYFDPFSLKYLIIRYAHIAR